MSVFAYFSCHCFIASQSGIISGKLRVQMAKCFRDPFEADIGIYRKKIQGQCVAWRKRHWSVLESRDTNIADRTKCEKIFMYN